MPQRLWILQPCADPSQVVECDGVLRVQRDQLLKQRTRALVISFQREPLCQIAAHGCVFVMTGEPSIEPRVRFAPLTGGYEYVMQLRDGARRIGRRRKCTLEHDGGLREALLRGEHV